MNYIQRQILDQLESGQGKRIFQLRKALKLTKPVLHSNLTRLISDGIIRKKIISHNNVIYFYNNMKGENTMAETAVAETKQVEQPNNLEGERTWMEYEILISLSSGYNTTRGISEATGISTAFVSKLLKRWEEKNIVEIDRSRKKHRFTITNKEFEKNRVENMKKILDAIVQKLRTISSSTSYKIAKCCGLHPTLVNKCCQWLCLKRTLKCIDGKYSYSLAYILSDEEISDKILKSFFDGTVNGPTSAETVAERIGISLDDYLRVRQMMVEEGTLHSVNNVITTTEKGRELGKKYIITKQEKIIMENKKPEETKLSKEMEDLIQSVSKTASESIQKGMFEIALKLKKEYDESIEQKMGQMTANVEKMAKEKVKEILLNQATKIL